MKSRRNAGVPRSYVEEKRALPFILPSLVILCFVSLYPLIQGISRVLYSFRALTGKNVYTGLDNFATLFRDHVFLQALVNSLVWTVTSVGVMFLISYVLATMLNSRYLRFRRAFRTVTLIPWALPGVVVSLIWRYMFLSGGPINTALSGLGFTHVPAWLIDPHVALWTCIIANIWMGIPFVTIMILAGLQSLEGELLEAAAIDGASYFQTQVRIIVPSIKKVILIVLTLQSIWTLNSFDIVFVLTKGGPANASMTLPLYAYTWAYGSQQAGYGAAIGIVILLMLLGVVVSYIREVLR
jgi:multiple sugar transport system permease protein